ncbi:DUF4132 domain-containing protein [Glycomyces terrestris]|uniref:DUF4132 domain-containing protein n=1 Tax=Glycomyces terrestris TaxID=2493553 RepID=A0A426V1J0_9ACTN|nr:DUF4132 domain-containing protein [Glycomyces terrestris]RRS00741.1 DUF4132 domain-containing protein [Glycomyces terrestris]
MSAQAPQEDRLELPAAWAAKLLPRRGSRTGEPVAIDPDAPDLLAEQLELHAELVPQLLRMKKNRPYRDSINAFLTGAPDPRGAAAVGTLLAHAGGHTSGWWSRLETHAWVKAHGLPWTVRAAIERYALQTSGWHSDGARPPLEHLQLTPPLGYEGRAVEGDLANGVVAELRALLAAASDEEYAAVVAAAAEHRDHPAKRFAAALLLPDQADWVAEVCAEAQGLHASTATQPILLQCASDPAHLAAAGVTDLGYYELELESIAALVDSLGAASLPILAATLESPWYLSAAVQRQLIKAIALLPGDEAAAHLVARLDKPFYLDGAIEAARRHPAAVLRAVAAAAGPASPAERGRLAVVAAAAGPLDRVPADVRAPIEGLTAALRPVPDADPADLPPLLVTPPWTVKRRKAKPVVLDLEPVAEDRLVWDEEQTAHAQRLRETYEQEPRVLADWSRFAANRTSNAYDYRLAQIAAYGPDGVAERMFADWAAHAAESYPSDVEAILHRHGTAAIAPALLVAERWGCSDFVLPMFSADTARFVAGRYARRKTERAAAAAWFALHGLAAATALVPDALGADRKHRRHAETALAHLATVHGAPAVVAAAEPYGPEAARAIAAFFDGDPLEPRGVTVPKPGPWAAPAMFPQVLLEGGGRALPEDSVRHLLTVLALAAPDYPYPGLDVVAETCDRASLARFSRAVFEQWLAVGAPAKDQWALTQLAHFPEDETVWLLAARLREWPGEGQHKRAVTALGVLGAIGTEEALRAVQTTAGKSNYQGLMWEATEQVERIRKELGLTAEQLADRLVPDFGLGEEGSRVVDYGPRKFTVAFDEQLKPYVVDESGKARKSLPRPGVKDDAVVAEDAHRRFQAFRKELKSVAAEQVSRLESAMTTGRSWAVGEFRRYCVEHALTGLLARRLVWLAEHDGASTEFRIAEDGTFSDVDDDAFDLPEDAAVRLAHPALLGDRVGAWAEVLADYEILQPFDQLDRPVDAFTEAELATGVVERFTGAVVATGRVLGLAKRGWNRAWPGDGGLVPGCTYLLGSGCFLVLSVAPGISLGYAAEHPEQTVASVRFCDRETFGADPVPPTAPIDPVAAAEALGSLARLVRA